MIYGKETSEIFLEFKVASRFGKVIPKKKERNAFIEKVNKYRTKV